MKKIKLHTIVLWLSIFVVAIGVVGSLSIFLTAAFYYIVFYLVYIITEKLIYQELRIKIRVVFFSILFTIFSGEMLLRFVFKSDLFYGERNNSILYPSLYSEKTIEKIYRKNILGQSDDELLSHIPNTKEIINKPEFSYLHRYNDFGLRGGKFKAIQLIIK